MGKKSLKINVLLNTVKTICSLIFPLITFPYITRTLGVDNIGKINFSNSIVSYFTLVAAFGVSSYAVREGAKRRENKKDFQEFSNEVFTINLITTFIAYALIFISMIVSIKIRNYSMLIALQSTSILFATLGVDWINTIFEDFTYITLRHLFFQIISLILMFSLVKTEADFYLYAFISVFASAGGNICNIFYTRRYTNVRFVISKKLLSHIRPMSMFFFSNITTIIFLNSDQTMLGIMSGTNGDYIVGLYSVSVKIYTIIKNVFTAVLTVVLPRVSNLSKTDPEKAGELINNVLNGFIIMILPMAVGLFLVSDGAIAFIGGEKYAAAALSLRILSISVLCAALASFMTYLIIIPNGLEHVMLQASISAAVINVTLNLLFIRWWSLNGAAITTALSELVVFLIELKLSDAHFDRKEVIRNSIQACIGCLGIVIVNYLIRKFVVNIFTVTFLMIPMSVIIYFISLMAFKNHYIIEILEIIRRRVFKKV